MSFSGVSVELFQRTRLVLVGAVWSRYCPRVPIPQLNEQGLLPAGLHDCTFEEIRNRFATFQGSDRRHQLFAKLEIFFSDAKAAKFIKAVIVDGSFVTGAPQPNDIDLIAVVASSHDFSDELSPAAYNVISKQRVRRRFGYDLLVAREGSVEFEDWTEFFQQVRLAPNERKGILRVRL